MTTTWKPDTCDCVIQYDDNGNFIKALRKCKLHEAETGNDLFNAVIAYNRAWNIYDEEIRAAKKAASKN